MAPQKPNGTGIDNVSGAPELSDDDRRRIDEEMTMAEQPAAADAAPMPESAQHEPAQPESALPAPAAVSERAADKASDSGRAAEAGQAGGKPRRGRVRRFLGGFWRHKKWTLPLLLLVILGVLAAVPFTRYALAGYVVKQQVVVKVVDASTKEQVSSADVALDGMAYKTDKDGRVTIPEVAPGKHQLAVGKKYYKESASEVLVPINRGIEKEVAIAATGRQVPVVVLNKITKKPVENATLKASGTEVKTGKDGKAVIVLPTGKDDLPITLAVDGYNTLEARVKVTASEVPENSFGLTPAGKLYFLSRQSGKIDVVKTDLDGANRQVVVHGTGKEDENATSLVATSDWKYLALHSRRDSGLAKLYVIDTATDKMTVMDEGDASFEALGWSGHNFVYGVVRNRMNEWEANKQAAKRYDADKRQLITIDQTSSRNGEGGSLVYQRFSRYHLLGDTLVYLAEWYMYNQAANYMSAAIQESHSLRSVLVGKDTVKDVKPFPNASYQSVDVKRHDANAVYIMAWLRGENRSEFFEYDVASGDVKSVTMTDADFYGKAYPVYFRSPSGSRTLWSEQRDGLATFFVGDAAGRNGKQIGAWDEYGGYGWFTEDYLLVSKKQSELYIVPAGGGKPLKVADYHKGQLGYGHGFAY